MPLSRDQEAGASKGREQEGGDHEWCVEYQADASKPVVAQRKSFDQRDAREDHVPGGHHLTTALPDRVLIVAGVEEEDEVRAGLKDEDSIGVRQLQVGDVVETAVGL